MALINPPAMKNDLLRQAEANMEAKIGNGPAREDYMKVVVAGMKAALAGGPQSIIGGLANNPDPVKACAVGAVSLVLHLRGISQGTMPERAMIPGAFTLMLQALDFAEQAGILKVGNAELDRATHIFANAIFQAFGISTAMLNKMGGAAGRVMEDPSMGPQIRQQLEAAGGQQGGQ